MNLLSSIWCFASDYFSRLFYLAPYGYRLSAIGYRLAVYANLAVITIRAHFKAISRLLRLTGGDLRLTSFIGISRISRGFYHRIFIQWTSRRLCCNSSNRRSNRCSNSSSFKWIRFYQVSLIFYFMTYDNKQLK